VLRSRYIAIAICAVVIGGFLYRIAEWLVT
jgi:hypothetical protein